MIKLFRRDFYLLLLFSLGNSENFGVSSRQITVLVSRSLYGMTYVPKNVQNSKLDDLVIVLDFLWINLPSSASSDALFLC